jgi:hypothetical protein
MFPAAGEAQVSPEKEQAIRKLMELTGAMDLGAQLSRSLLEQLRPAFPQVPDSVWAEFSKSLDPAETTELVIPIYDRHFSLSELQALIGRVNSRV